MNNIKSDSYTPSNAPFSYAKTGSKGIIMAIGMIIVLYFVGVVVGIYLGYGWGSIMLPILIYFILVGVGYIGLWIYSKIGYLFR